jgi:hypothetical protein
MRGVTFALGFVSFAALSTLVIGLWFNQPDPAMSDTDALAIIAWCTAIGCVASTLAFCASLVVSRHRPSVLQCFIYGNLALIFTWVLFFVSAQVFPPPSPWSWLSSPFVPLGTLIAVSLALPWLGNILHVNGDKVAG